jgi:predicted AAA+ superfamily ATPase
LGKSFSLIDTLFRGALPLVVTSPGPDVQRAVLQSYVDTYLKEEILQEQIVRNVVPFRKFLSIASQLSGTILNYNRIAED